MNILVVCAHPDDETISMGGTLKKISKNNKITVLFMNDGVTGRRQPGFYSKADYEISSVHLDAIKKDIMLRQEHARKSCSILGINDIIFLNFPNVEMDTIPLLKIIKQIEKTILDLKTQIIFTHHYNDLNVDHRITFEAVITAARPFPDSTVSSIFSFESIPDSSWRRPNKFNPNMFVDITDEIDTKISALNSYKYEIRKSPHPRNEEMTRAVAKKWGGLSGYNFAEAFEIVLHRTKNPLEII